MDPNLNNYNNYKYKSVEQRKNGVWGTHKKAILTLGPLCASAYEPNRYTSDLRVLNKGHIRC